LTIKPKGVSVDLNASESLIVINISAVKRSALRGGLWSATGKSVEKYYNADHFVRDRGRKVDREIDFYFLNNEKEYLCEVKLMGKGNPESAGAVIAKDGDAFVADALSKQNKNQCDQLEIHWVASHDANGYKRFKLDMEKLGVPRIEYNGNLDEDLSLILDE
jgi:hypothetical protein